MNHNSTLNTKLSSVKTDAYSINQDKISLTENYVYKKPEKKQMKLSFMKLDDVEKEVDELLLLDERKLQRSIVYENSGYNASGFTPDRKRLGISTQTNRLSTPFTYNGSSSNESSSNASSNSRSMSLDLTSNSSRSNISLDSIYSPVSPLSSTSSSSISIDKNFNLFEQSMLNTKTLKRSADTPLLNIAKRTKLTPPEIIENTDTTRTLLIKPKRTKLTMAQKIDKLENDDFLKREGLMTLFKKKKATSPKASGSKDIEKPDNYDFTLSRIENLKKKQRTEY